MGRLPTTRSCEDLNLPNPWAPKLARGVLAQTNLEANACNIQQVAPLEQAGLSKATESLMQGQGSGGGKAWLCLDVKADKKIPKRGSILFRVDSLRMELYS